MKRKGFVLVIAFTLLTLFSIVPQIFASEANSVTTLEIIALVEQLDADDQFANESAIRTLKMHLTAVNHFELQGETDKVVEHMNSFKHLMGHYRNIEFISVHALVSTMRQRTRRSIVLLSILMRTRMLRRIR